MASAKRLFTTDGVEVSGPLLISPKVFGDQRGFFYESWNQKSFHQLLADDGQLQSDFVQDNHSCSSLAVLRGLHYQIPPHAQGKLVRCVVGEIYDVAVDIRRESPTYGQWVGASLTAANHQLLWIPAGFAHGFLTMSCQAEVLYKATDFWSPSCERSILWNDPKLAIAWPDLINHPSPDTPILSGKDADAPLLADQPCVF